jgi:hypothetical protein
MGLGTIAGGAGGGIAGVAIGLGAAGQILTGGAGSAVALGAAIGICAGRCEQQGCSLDQTPF